MSKKLIYVLSFLLVVGLGITNVKADWKYDEILSREMKYYDLDDDIFGPYEKQIKKEKLSFKDLSHQLDVPDSYNLNEDLLGSYASMYNLRFQDEDMNVNDKVPVDYIFLPRLKDSTERSIGLRFYLARTSEIENRFEKKIAKEEKERLKALKETDIKQYEMEKKYYDHGLYYDPKEYDYIDELEDEFVKKKIGGYDAYCYEGHDGLIRSVSYKEVYEIPTPSDLPSNEATLNSLVSQGVYDNIQSFDYKNEKKWIKQYEYMDYQSVIYLVRDTIYDDLKLVMRFNASRHFNFDDLIEDYYMILGDNKDRQSETYGGWDKPNYTLKKNDTGYYFDAVEPSNYPGVYLKEYWGTTDEEATTKALNVLRSMGIMNEIESEVARLSESVIYQVQETVLATTSVAGIIDKDASSKLGEDEGVTIPKALLGSLLGVASPLVALASVNLVKKKKKDEDDDDEYRLVVDKNFKDTLKLDDETKNIYIKLKKYLADGTVINRSDLGHMIRLTEGQYIKFSNLNPNDTISDSYAKAVGLVVVDFPEGVTTDYILVTFEGEEGNFTERLHFNLVGKTELVFVDQANYLSGLTVPIVADSSYTYKIPFVIQNAIDVPVKINLTSEDKVSLTYQKLDDFSYDIYAKPKLEKMDNIFLNNSYLTVKVEVLFDKRSSEKTLEKEFRLEVFPLGFSAKLPYLNKDNKFEVKLYENKNSVKDPLDTSIDPLYLKLFFTKIIDKGEYQMVDFHKFSTNTVSLKFDPMDDRTYVKKMLEKLEYKVSEYDIEDSNLIIYFNHVVPAYYEKTDKYMSNPKTYDSIINLKLSLDEEYSLAIPTYFRGKEIDKMGIWEHEYDELIKAVKEYTPESQREYYTKTFLTLAKYRSVEEIRVLRKEIVSKANARYQQEAEADLAYCHYLDKWIIALECTKTIGDLCFSYLMTFYFGDIAEAVITPTKEMFVDFVAEVCNQLYYGEPITFESLKFYDTIYSVAENLITGDLDFTKLIKPDERKKMATLIGFLIVEQIAKSMITTYQKANEYEDKVAKLKEEVDSGFASAKTVEEYESLVKKEANYPRYNIAKAIMDTFNDLTVRFFQNLAFSAIVEFFNIKVIKENFTDACTNFFNEKFKNFAVDVAKFNEDKYDEAIEKGAHLASKGAYKDLVIVGDDLVRNIKNVEIFDFAKKAELFAKYINNKVGDGVMTILTDDVNYDHENNKASDLIIYIPLILKKEQEVDVKVMVDGKEVIEKQTKEVECRINVTRLLDNSLDKGYEFAWFLYSMTPFSLIIPWDKPEKLTRDLPINDSETSR